LLGYLLLSHVYLILTNQTTSEHLKKTYKLNPYDLRSIFRNIQDFMRKSKIKSKVIKECFKTNKVDVVMESTINEKNHLKGHTQSIHSNINDF
jgi:hypothetical protein